MLAPPTRSGLYLTYRAEVPGDEAPLPGSLDPSLTWLWVQVVQGYRLLLSTLTYQFQRAQPQAGPNPLSGILPEISPA